MDAKVIELLVNAEAKDLAKKLVSDAIDSMDEKGVNILNTELRVEFVCSDDQLRCNCYLFGKDLSK